MNSLQLTWLRLSERSPDARPLLVIDDLAVRVGMRRVLDGVSLSVFPGDHLRITGPNGCGKSTLLNAIAGVAPARIERGSIRLDGTDIAAWPSHERARQGIAYMRQVDHVFFALSVNENLTMALGRSGYDRFAEHFPNWVADFPPNKRAGHLSGGQRKKLAWGMTVLKSAPLILADEPEAGVSQGLSPPVEKTYVVVTHQ